MSNPLDDLLGKEFSILDAGFVRVIDYMGDDSSIVDAARISYGRGTRQVSKDRGLIRYLMRHQHTTPFEMCELKLHVRVPMDTWRQWIRHRTASVNEYSTRYSIAINKKQRTEPRQWRLQSELNRQGSGRFLDDSNGEKLTAAEMQLHKKSQAVYDGRIKLGVAREQARKDLPLSTYTEAFWKIDLHNLFHFLELRMNDHAQLEIREYANLIGKEIVSKWVPLAWEAFVDYRLSKLVFSEIELGLLRMLIASDPDQALEYAKQIGWVERDGSTKPNRERDEFVRKLERLGTRPPW